MSLSLIRNHLQTAGEHVGDMLWWTLQDARISRARLEEVWTGAGLSTALLPEPPTPEKALRTAVREAAVGQQGHLIRLGKEDDDELVFAVVEEQRDGAGNVSYRQEARLILQKQATPALASDAPDHELVRAVRERYEGLLRTHTPDDVRRALVKTLASCAAVTLREHGGIYWVPAPFAATLRRLQMAVAGIGGSRIDVVPVHASPEASKALGDAARSALEQDLALLTAEIDAFLREPPDRVSTLTRRLATFDELRAKARLYHSVLHVQVSDLDAKLDDLTRHVEGLLQAKAS
ncbi:hypothetical protein A2cp1_1121 [Anaeromyxobacter dehalogenans 2CP-1]|uniref:Uncharacterized protein n=1 Tax=Anaeromyxobacter dehalogenans (strain ATCC BAA-258 / DSM 21875 / 2CP-1) TaxID=455488 RepID=B8JFA9_ANAD2|nr:DUF6744 family protein [Anaeromyxobacter dehalogenans]ACL64466.1 hypothetical protein A2cp1_1121 [Anaeromyxobacter dehalogenans 2CP-1]